MIVFVPVSIFEHKPQSLPVSAMSFWPGGAPGQLEALHLRGGQGRGPNEAAAWAMYGSSAAPVHDQLRQTTFYEPPHDIRHHQAGA